MSTIKKSLVALGVVVCLLAVTGTVYLRYCVKQARERSQNILTYIKNNDIDNVKFILKWYPDAANNKYEDEFDSELSPLAKAATEGRRSIARMLLPCMTGEKFQEEISYALFCAVSSDQIEIARDLVGQKATLDYIDPISETSLLQSVAAGGYTQILEMLLKAGADPNFRGPYENLPLHYAVGYDRPGCFELLIKYGAKLELKNQRGQTPLDSAKDKAMYDRYKELAAEVQLQIKKKPNAK